MALTNGQKNGTEMIYTVGELLEMIKDLDPSTIVQTEDIRAGIDDGGYVTHYNGKLTITFGS